MSAITTGGFVVRSKTTTLELPFPTYRVLPSAVTTTPLGPDIGFTPWPRAAQHWAPVNPPKLPLGPKPEDRPKGSVVPGTAVLQPNRVKFPFTPRIGGMIGF